MYPVYPCLAFNAAVSLQVLSDLLLKQATPKGKNTSRSLISNIDHIISLIPFRLRQLSFYGLLALSAVLGLWRSVGLATAYNAPFDIYSQLPSDLTQDTNVCVGKEWYRFPSSFYLPSTTSLSDGATHGTARLKFITSSFHGLLPGSFVEFDAFNSHRPWTGTRVIPPGMNDRNQEDLGKYTNIDQCDYLIDSSLPSWTPNEEELAYVGLAEKEVGWKVVACEDFLDAASTGFLGRVGWAPKGMRVWGKYCLLERTAGRSA